MDHSMPPPQPPRRNPTSSSMPPPPPPKPSPPSLPSQPKADTASRPEESAVEEGNAKPTSSLSMLPPKPSPSPQLDEETMPDASAEGSPVVSALAAEEAENRSRGTEMAEAAPEQRQQQRPGALYVIPAWSAVPCHAFFLEVIKKGVRVGRLDVSNKEVYLFGRMDLCHFVLEHQSVSRYHAVLQFRKDGDVYLYDLGSKHGSFVNKIQIKKRIYTKIHVGDIITFGQSSVQFIFGGPTELMHLVADMKKEIDAIRDISQAGGLTEGQQQHITHIKQRISQIMEEIKHLEQTLNASVHESLGARSRKPNEQLLVETADSLLEKKHGIKSKEKLVEEDMNSERDNEGLRDNNGCIRDSIQQKSSSPTTIDSLSEDLLLDIFLHLPSIECVIRAACSYSVWRNAIASSPLFRRKCLGLCPAPLLGLFFDPPSTVAPAFPAFVPVRNEIDYVPIAVRWGDFFITELQRQPVVPPNWTVSDVRGGLMLLTNPDDMLLLVDPLQGRSEGYFDLHEVRILMDYRGTAPRILQAHLVCDEAYTGRFAVICLAHDVSRVRVAVFGSSIGGRGFILPWFEVAPRQNQLDEEGGWLTEGVQAGESIYWPSTNHQFVVILDTKTLAFSVEYLPDLNVNNLGNCAFGETRNGKLCLAYTQGPRLVIMCSQIDHNISGPWDVLHEASLQDLAFLHGEIRVAGIRKGVSYLMASRGFHQYGVPCWIATYDMQNHRVEVKCQWMSTDVFQPFHLPWPKFLSSQGQASAAKAQRHFQRFERMSVVKDIILVKAIYSCQLNVMKNPQCYQSWYKYIILEKKHGDKNRVRDIYEKALSCLPTEDEKWFWDTYIALWLSYAIYEEEEAGDIDSARKVYTRCLGVISNKTFTFSAVWTMAANLEIRQKDVEAACRILRTGIEKHPTVKLYRRLIDIEYLLENHDIWRDLFETFLEWLPMNRDGWMEYAEKEHKIGEVERARAVYKRAIQQPSFDLPMEVLWKDYLFFEISENEVENAREIYEKLLVITKDVEAWLSYAKYEASEDCNNSKIDRIQNCRSVFKRALEYYGNCGDLDKREKLIKAWSKHEKSFGVCGSSIPPEYILSSTLKRKRNSSSYDISTEKRRKKDAGDNQISH